MHFCVLNKVFLGLGYDFYSPTLMDYGIMTFELYQCTKCKKLFYVNKIFMPDEHKELFEDRIHRIESIGYKPIGKLIELLN